MPFQPQDTLSHVDEERGSEKHIHCIFLYIQYNLYTLILNIFTGYSHMIALFEEQTGI